MPFTVNKKLSVQAAGTNSSVWGAGSTGNDLNTGVIGLLDTIVAGLSTISLSSSNYNLTFVSGGGGDVSNAMLRFTGSLLANIIVSPAAGDATTYFNGFYYWENLTSGAFSITLQNAAGSTVLPQNRRGVLFVDGTNGPRIVSEVSSIAGAADVLPAGSTILFMQGSVPTGWTQNTNINDYAIRFVSGAGGGTHGSTAFSTVFNQASTGGYALQVGDLANHTHQFTYNTGQPLNVQGGGEVETKNIQQSGGNNTVTTQGTGSGNAHSHPISLQPFYVDVIGGVRS